MIKEDEGGHQSPLLVHGNKAAVTNTVNEKNESGLLVQVKEGNTNTFDGIIGYVPPANDEEKGYFMG